MGVVGVIMYFYVFVCLWWRGSHILTITHASTYTSTHTSQQVLMMAKTRAALLPEFAAFVKAHHSYTVPETIAAGIVGGAGPYLDWLRAETKQG